MRLFLPLLMLLAALPLHAQSSEATLPPGVTPDPSLDEALHTIVADLGLNGPFHVGAEETEQLSLAVIEMPAEGSPESARFGGVSPDNFIYPASVYKMYVAAEVLRQIEAGAYALDTEVIARAPNTVDTQKDIPWDPRPLLQDGDTVTIGYLLDLMLTRSDNSAANVLIDRATRPSIDALLHRYGWHGSEVTRKFLPRSQEAPGYAEVRSTMTCARHAADFLYRMATRQLASPWVSRQLETFLGRQLDNRKLVANLPPSAMAYHKTGWWSAWTHDVGVVVDGDVSAGGVRYVVAALLPVAEADARPLLRALGTRIHALMQTRAQPSHDG